MSIKGAIKKSTPTKSAKKTSIPEIFVIIVQLATLEPLEQAKAIEEFKEKFKKRLTNKTHFKALLKYLSKEVDLARPIDLRDKKQLGVLDQNMSICRFFLLNIWPDLFDDKVKDKFILNIVNSMSVWLKETLTIIESHASSENLNPQTVLRFRQNCHFLSELFPVYQKMIAHWVKNPHRDVRRHPEKPNDIRLLFNPIQSLLKLNAVTGEDIQPLFEQLAQLEERLTPNKTLAKHLDLDQKTFQQWISDGVIKAKKCYQKPTQHSTAPQGLVRLLSSIDFFLSAEFELHAGKLTPKNSNSKNDVDNESYKLQIGHLLKNIQNSPLELLDLSLKTLCIYIPFLISKPENFSVPDYTLMLKALKLFEARVDAYQDETAAEIRTRVNTISANIKRVLEEKMGIHKKKPPTSPSVKEKSLSLFSKLRLPTPPSDNSINMITININPEDIPFEERDATQQFIDAPRTQNVAHKQKRCQYLLQRYKRELQDHQFMDRLIEELNAYDQFIKQVIASQQDLTQKFYFQCEAIYTYEYFINQVLPKNKNFNVNASYICLPFIEHLHGATETICTLISTEPKSTRLPSPKNMFGNFLEKAFEKYKQAIDQVSKGILQQPTKKENHHTITEAGKLLIKTYLRLSESCESKQEKIKFDSIAKEVEECLRQHLTFVIAQQQKPLLLKSTSDEAKPKRKQSQDMLSKSPEKSENEPSPFLKATPKLMRELFFDPIPIGDDQVLQLEDAFQIMRLNQPVSTLTSDESKDDVSDEIASLRLEVEKLKLSVEKQKKSEQAHDVQTDALEHDLAQLRLDLKKQRKDNSVADTELKSLKSKHKNLIRDNQLTLKVNRKIKGENAALRTKQTAHEATILELRTDQAELEELISSIRRDHQEELSRQSKRSEKLSHKLVRTQSYADTQKEELDKSKLINRKLQEALCELQQKNDSQDSLISQLQREKEVLQASLEQRPSQEQLSSMRQKMLFLHQQAMEQDNLLSEEKCERQALEKKLSETQQALERSESMMPLFRPKQMSKAERFKILTEQENFFKVKLAADPHLSQPDNLEVKVFKLTFKPDSYQEKQIKRVQKLMCHLEGGEDSFERAYLDGGLIRCHLTGLQHSDIDLITTRSQDWIKEHCKSFKQNPYMPWLFTDYSNPQCHIDLVSNPDLDLKVQANLRDLSCNALFANKDLELIDPLCHGLSDIINKKFHVIGDACDRFKEDPKKTFRLIRFWCELQWPLDLEYMLAIKIRSKDLSNLPYAVYLKNLNTLFAQPKVALSAITQLGILSEMFGFAELDSARNHATMNQFWDHQLSQQTGRSVISLFLLHPYLLRQQTTSKPMAKEIIHQFLNLFKHDDAFRVETKLKMTHQNLVDDLIFYTLEYSKFCKRLHKSKDSGKSRTFTPGHDTQRRAQSTSPILQHTTDTASYASVTKKKHSRKKSFE